MERDDAARADWERRNQSRTMLFEAYALVVEYLQPRWFLFENVPAIRSHARFDEISNRFQNLRGMDGAQIPYGITSDNYWASIFGVPQDRRRFLMVGVHPDVRTTGWRVPEQKPAPTVRQAIGDLPAVPNGHRLSALVHEREPMSEFQAEMRRQLDGDPCRTIHNHVCRLHNPDDVALFERMAPGARFSDPEVQQALREINPSHKLAKYSVEKFQDKLHKLDPDRPSWTVTAHLQKDCYKFIHYGQPRTISVREAARLQSFPDWFVFPDVLGPAFRLIGNAIPPLLARAFAESFRFADPRL